MTDDETPLRQTAVAQSQQSAEGPPVVLSEHLLKGSREIIIRHGGEAYRLRLTRAGKLILNK